MNLLGSFVCAVQSRTLPWGDAFEPRERLAHDENALRFQGVEMVHALTGHRLLQHRRERDAHAVHFGGHQDLAGEAGIAFDREGGIELLHLLAGRRI